MRKLLVTSAALLALGGGPAKPDLRAVLEADNARWNAAFNTPDAAALASMYAPDAILLAPGEQPITGPEAIARYFQGSVDAGVKEHGFEVVSVRRDGRYAYQVARWTAARFGAGGARTPLSGNTVRVYERQPDGRWLTVVHTFSQHDRT
jgi:uncharacterized protein (TIGR02246 family)